MQTQQLPCLLQQINSELIKNSGIKLYLLRIDLIHQFFGGNKWFKLKHNLTVAKNKNYSTLLTFGGAFSNHIAATAAAGKEHGLKTIGIIRGEEHKELNPTLKFAVDNGMHLKYISRDTYRNKNSDAFIQSLEQEFGDFYLIPEGGSNTLGLKGCQEIIQHIPIDFDYVCCACGTGTTLAGIILSLEKEQYAIGFQILKANGYIQQEVNQWLNQFDYSSKNWHIEQDFHFGGYAKTDTELIGFIRDFEKNNCIPLDFIYTGKMMFGIYNLIRKGDFKNGETIIAIHTGGLQGNEGFNL
jgi:1-aminocyclopropane-1-carboxylate deaminase/D-cysteine desulfhydrase-like pyridoxal-dependent ACC family enzyme